MDENEVKLNVEDLVYHRSNPSIRMLITELFKHQSKDACKCSWVDKLGRPQEHSYYEYELKKTW